MAGEIEQPEVVFPKAIAILIPTLATVRSIDAVRCPSVRSSVRPSVRAVCLAVCSSSGSGRGLTCPSAAGHSVWTAGVLPAVCCFHLNGSTDAEVRSRSLFCTGVRAGWRLDAMATLHWFFCLLRWTVRLDIAIAGLPGRLLFAFVPTDTLARWQQNCATCFYQIC